MDKQQAYQLLGIQEGASKQEIAAAIKGKREQTKEKQAAAPPR